MIGFKPRLLGPERYAILGQYQVWRPDDKTGLSTDYYNLMYVSTWEEDAYANSKPGDMIIFVQAVKIRHVRTKQETAMTDWTKVR